MFFNPQATLPLPIRPNPEHYKKLAKDLIKVCKSDDPNAIGDWAEAWVKMLVKRSGLKLGRKEPFAIQRWTEQVEAFAQRRLISRSMICCVVMAVCRSLRGIGLVKTRVAPVRIDRAFCLCRYGFGHEIFLTAARLKHSRFQYLFAVDSE